MRRWLVPLVVVALAFAALALVRAGGGKAASRVDGAPRPAPPDDLARFSAEPLAEPVDLLFLHRSIGGHLLSDPGPDDGRWHVHPNGGGLRTLLTQNGYRVHDATYGSTYGEPTDMFDWLPKFRDHMDDVLALDVQDARLPAGRKNRVVLFKSCFPNNYFVAAGEAPGNPAGPQLTLENAKASFRALLPLFEKRADTLFVYLTTPPNVGVARDEPLGKLLLKRLVGKPGPREQLETHGQLARAFADWAADKDGWLAGYRGKNVVAFHLFDVLTGGGESNFLRYPTGPDGMDDHPSREGLSQAARALVPFVNRAVRRVGVVPGATTASATP